MGMPPRVVGVTLGLWHYGKNTDNKKTRNKNYDRACKCADLRIEKEVEIYAKNLAKKKPSA
jgi:hypothetical protein